jgi:hypothetical protein
MRKMIALSVLAVLLTISTQEGVFGKDAIQIGDSTFKIYIDSVESGTSFLAYADKLPPL